MCFLIDLNKTIKKMRNLIVFLLFISLNAIGQDQAQLLVSNVTLKSEAWSHTNPNSFTIRLTDGNRQNQIPFYNGSDFSLSADFRIDAIQSKRSSVKAGSIRLKTIYHLLGGNRRDKRTTEKIIYLGDIKEYEVVENFVIFNGFNSIKVTLSYKVKITNL
jgi:hypothetical protein